MKYSLRSLMIVVALGPPLLAAGVFLWRERQTQKLAFMAGGVIAFSIWLWFEFRPTISHMSAADDRPTTPRPPLIETGNFDWLTNQMRQEELARLESQTMEASND